MEQTRASKKVNGGKLSLYKEMLKILGLFSFERRLRERV